MHSLPELAFLCLAIGAAAAFMITLLTVQIYVALPPRGTRHTPAREVTPATRLGHGADGDVANIHETPGVSGVEPAQ